MESKCLSLNLVEILLLMKLLKKGILSFIHPLFFIIFNHSFFQKVLIIKETRDGLPVYGLIQTILIIVPLGKVCLPSLFLFLKKVLCLFNNQLIIIVPANPSVGGQILFYFNSFESAAYNDILQPVLQVSFFYFSFSSFSFFY